MRDPLEVLWGKSNASGRIHLLIAHLLDSAAVGEIMWDSYLSPALRRSIDDCCDGRGRALLALLCGLHDVGKATPAFQSKDDALAAAVRSAGLEIAVTRNEVRSWHHTLAGAKIVMSYLGSAGWSHSAQQWFWPLIAGHHGRVPEASALRSNHRQHGRGLWAAAQHALVDRVVAELNLDLSALTRVRRPPRAVQLALSGLVIMADWIASNDRHFDGVSDLGGVTMAAARARAAGAWKALGLRGGWATAALAGAAEPDLVRRRFGRPAARPSQRDAVALAETMESPGLLILEAPMGEGKTEAALAAAEVLARRFGADGLFVGMPTQATSDPMFNRVRRWLATIDERVPIALLHGRSRFNEDWARLREAARFRGVSDDLDQFGMAETYGEVAGCEDVTGQAAAEWFLGRKRGLLSPVAVGTVDQLLHAATRTKHVMLRHAGLAGRVVVLDEVHAYDVYMSQFLFEALRWLAEAGVPVVLLSATLPPALRAALIQAYAQGATGERDVQVPPRSDTGYPRATAVTTVGGAPSVRAVTGVAWRASVHVQVDILAETPEFEPAAVARAVLDGVRGGGCALVVCNTVDRTQAVHRLVRAALGADVVLLHARLTAATRAERTGRLVDLLGEHGDRPSRLVIVATQLAEQSFDVDVDLLVSDLAPIDLLLQRVGRLHRHARPPRPESVREPRVIVSGLRLGAGDPQFPRGSRAVYGEHLLLRAAALVDRAQRTGWSVPAQVPELVAAGYGDEPLGPGEWAQAAASARAAHEVSQERRASRAATFLLAGEDALGTPTLAGLHRVRTADLDDEEKVAAVVRDGAPSVEVVLVQRIEGGYLTLAGRPIGPQGEAVSDDMVLGEVVGSTVRLPARELITTAALAELAPLSGWAQDPWLGKVRALVLDVQRSTVLGGHRLTYDDELGLVVGPVARRRPT